MIKLGDFGLSRRISEKLNVPLFTMLPYIDPQLFKKRDYKANKKSDVYSVGVLLWEISSGRSPFAYNKPSVLMNEIPNGKREIPISDTPIDYIQIYTSTVYISLFI